MSVVERRLGIAGGHRGGMPAFALDTGDKAGIIAYLRNMNTLEATAVRTSDAAPERAAFTGKGVCSNCHRVGATGPHPSASVVR